MRKKWLLGALLMLALGLSACGGGATDTTGNWDTSNWDSAAVWQ